MTASPNGGRWDTTELGGPTEYPDAAGDRAMTVQQVMSKALSGGCTGFARRKFSAGRPGACAAGEGGMKRTGIAGWLINVRHFHQIA